MFIILSARFGPTLMKYSLNLLAISIGSFVLFVELAIINSLGRLLVFCFLLMTLFKVCQIILELFLYFSSCSS